jgi:hypothetical protein
MAAPFRQASRRKVSTSVGKDIQALLLNQGTAVELEEGVLQIRAVPSGDTRTDPVHYHGGSIAHARPLPQTMPEDPAKWRVFRRGKGGVLAPPRTRCIITWNRHLALVLLKEGKGIVSLTP